MEKLLNLLNEYEKVIGTDRVWGGAIDDGFFFCTRKSKKGNLTVQHSSEYEAISQIISKKFGFIQWLAENGKMDKDRADNILYETEMFNRDPHTDFTDRLLMYLAISDDPIRLLVSLLK